MARTREHASGPAVGLLVISLGFAGGCGDDDAVLSVRDASPGRDAGPDRVPDAGPDAGVDGGAPAAQAVDAIRAGAFAPLPAYAGMEFRGRAQLLLRPDGATVVQVHATGLTPDTAHAVHVHALPCEFEGGGHYKIDPSETETVEANEIWPAFTTDADGAGHAGVTASHRARGDALSVVIHDPGSGDKMVCADLTPDDEADVTASGTFAAFAAAEAVDQSIGGTATLVRQAAATQISVAVTGLDPAATYASHVHALPCEVGDAGPHYKLDPTETATVEANEIWPVIEDYADGSAENNLESMGHAARGDAQAVVIHRRFPDDSTPKVACANLVRQSWPPLVTTGDVVPFPEAATRGYNTLGGTATMTRALNGETTAELNINGLTSGQEYPVHVHDRPCDLADGGAHYKLDPTEAATVATNEIWLNFIADGTGAGLVSTTVAHTARPEAQSVVVHDSSDGARIACVDLD